MPFSIELRLDRESENRIRAIWSEAAEFYGTNHVLENGVIPHVALLVGDSRLQAVFERLDVPVVRLALPGIGFFGGGDIAYLRAEIPPEVVTFQQRAYDQAVQLGAQIETYYRPDQWVPHCTIAQNCRTHREEPLKAGSIDAGIESLILVRHPPTTLIAEQPRKRPNHNKVEPTRAQSGARGSP